MELSTIELPGDRAAPADAHRLGVAGPLRPASRCGWSRRPAPAARSTSGWRSLAGAADDAAADRRRRPRRPARGLGARARTSRSILLASARLPGRAARTSAARPPTARDWIRPQLGDWGGVDADDVHAAIDHVIGLGLADPDRLGVLGLSYGGFMVNWLVGTTDRFQAAVSENGVTNQVNAMGQLRLRPRVRPDGADGRPAHARAASTSCGASRRCATWRTSTPRC